MKNASITLCALLLLTACARGAQPSDGEITARLDEDRSTDRFVNVGSKDDHFMIMEDTETGCRYLTRYRGGITPLLGADKTPDCAGHGAGSSSDS